MIDWLVQYFRYGADLQALGNAVFGRVSDVLFQVENRFDRPRFYARGHTHRPTVVGETLGRQAYWRWYEVTWDADVHASAVSYRGFRPRDARRFGELLRPDWPRTQALVDMAYFRMITRIYDATLARLSAPHYFSDGAPGWYWAGYHWSVPEIRGRLPYSTLISRRLA